MNNKNNQADYALVKCNNNNYTLKANPALCKHSTIKTIKTTAQIMHKSDNNDNNNKDTTVPAAINRTLY